MTDPTASPWIVKADWVETQHPQRPYAPIAHVTTKQPSWKANARLIAAAPDLYRIGKGLLAYTHSEPDIYVLNALLAELEEVVAGIRQPS